MKRGKGYAEWELSPIFGKPNEKDKPIDMDPRNNYGVIMAGGIGSRFWPLSKNRMPKQFLDILGTGKSFIRSTFERFLPVVPVENILVVTSALYKDLVLRHLPELRPEQVLTEPVRRNTAPCIAYAAYRIAAENPQANMIVAPSDHLITGEAEFQNILREGLAFVGGTEKLLTIGIRPSRPETGYGYIQIDTAPRSETEGTSICKVKTFTEKPNLEMARVFVESGEFFGTPAFSSGPCPASSRRWTPACPICPHASPPGKATTAPHPNSRSSMPYTPRARTYRSITA